MISRIFSVTATVCCGLRAQFSQLTKSQRYSVNVLLNHCSFDKKWSFEVTLCQGVTSKKSKSASLICFINQEAFILRSFTPITLNSERKI